MNVPDIRITCLLTFCLATLTFAIDHPGTWSELAPLPRKRQELPVTYLNGKIYAAGGMNSGSCCNALNDFDEYDIATNTWRARADLPVAVNHPVLCALDGKIYVMSGYTGGSYSDQGVTNRCFVYTPSSDSWQEIASMDKPAAAAGVVTWNGKIYVFGGDPDPQFDSNPRSTVLEYDPANDSWRTVNSDMPYARTHIGAGLVGDKVYLSPGRRGRIRKTQDDIVQEFDLTKMNSGADAWREMNRLPSDYRTGYMSNWPVVNGRLYYIGGESPMYKTVHELTPDADGGTWRRVTDYPTTIHGIGPIGVGNKIYVCGGAAGSGVSDCTDKVYVYTIQGVDPPPPAVSLSRVSDTDDNLGCYRIETPAATYYYDTVGCGFSSVVDPDGNDWINYNAASHADGQDRGLPNMGWKQFGHPGYGTAIYTDKKGITTVVEQTDTHITINSTSQDGSWDVDWDFYPTHATQTINAVGGSWWWQYEGTTGGENDFGTDYYTLSNGTVNTIDQTWSGDLAPEEWAFFVDPADRHAIYFVNHTPDANTVTATRYGDMSIVGWGRPENCCSGWGMKDMSYPHRFSFGIAADTTAAGIEATVAAVLAGSSPVAGKPRECSPQAAALPRNVSVKPGDGRLHFSVSGAATAEVLSLNGQLLKRYSFAGAGSYSVAAPRFRGVYLVRAQARTFVVGW